MSKVTNQLDSIIRNAGWAKAFAEMDNVMKFKKITGVDWVTEDFFNDADNEPKLLWMIASGQAFPKIGDGDDPRPDVHPNTPEQNEIQEDIIAKVLNGDAKITFEGEANNITIPAGAAKSITITGEFQDGFTITNLSGKSVTVENTGEAADVIIDADNASSLTLKGNYKKVWANVKSVTASNARVDSVHFDQALEGKGTLSVNANWNDPVEIVSYNTNSLNIRNASDATVLEQISITAPNATVTVYGKWGEVIATVGSDTIKLDASFHASILNVLKGNAIVNNCFPMECADEIHIADGYSIMPNTYNVVETKSLIKDAGVYNIDGEVEAYGYFPMFGIGNYKYVNNGHITAKNKDGLLVIRPAINAILEGDGLWENQNGYGIWKANNAGLIKIMSGTFKAQTHVVYAEKGFIEIHGGEFELVNTEDKKFLLNCFDANYKAGTAGIKVFGGKFHDFDPANSMSEPAGPVSFVADGYKSVQTAENIWEVFPEDAEVEPWVPTVDTPEQPVDENPAEQPAE